MAHGTCAATEGCATLVPDPGGARGLCNKHYLRWKRHGSTDVVLPRGWKGSPEERFWVKVNKNGPIPTVRPDLGPCWLWTGTLDRDGYGVFGVERATVGAHGFAYALLIGPIPDGLEPDHLCRNPACVNPSHMELVTHRINLLRGDSPAGLNARKRTCPEGHAYDRVGSRGERRCSKCDNSRARARYRSRKKHVD